MSQQAAKTPLLQQQVSDEQYRNQLASRNRTGRAWGGLFFFSNILALVVLLILIAHVINSSFGLVVVRNSIPPADLSDRPLTELNEAELVSIILANAPNRLRVMIRDSLSQVEDANFTTAGLDNVLAGRVYPPQHAKATINDLTEDELAFVLSENLSRDEIYDLVISNIVRPLVIKSWQLLPSVFNRAEIEAEFARDFEGDSLEFRNWISLDFITSSVSSSPTTAGLRTALLGSFWIIGITAITALIIGVSAAIYLEEYASDNWINRLIEINIRNLAAIPSVIYGMLGLAVFVRALGEITSGAVFGVTDTNGRTVLSAGLTLALLVLPVLIVNAQEAIRAVPSSIREASYGLGATRWQTVSRQVLPAAMPGILTGIILSMSRAVGETAPLLVVGASTFIGINPEGPFSKFTVVPIQIYQWTSRPEQEFKNLAAAAIIALLAVMLLLNGTAIFLRNRLSRRF